MRNRAGSLPLTAFAASVVAMSLVSCSENPEGSGKIDCASVNAEATENLVAMAEQAIWDLNLYKTDKPVPSELLRGGKPIPIAEMSEKQGDIFFGWKSGNDAYMDTAQDRLDELQREAQATGFVKDC